MKQYETQWEKFKQKINENNRNIQNRENNEKYHKISKNIINYHNNS